MRARLHGIVRLVLLSVALLLPQVVRAGNGITTATVQLERTLTGIGVRLIISGDDDTSAVARIFYRPDGSTNPYDSGMVMVRRPGSRIHAGRILWLTPGQRVQFYVEATDAGGSFSSTPDTASAAGVRGVKATGPVYYVSKAGSDANSGLTPALAVKTLATARTKLIASTGVGLNGGIILIGPGIWYERFDGSFGTPGATDGWFLIGDGANRDSTILDGSYEPGVNGQANNTTAIAWTSTGVDSIYKTFYPAGDSCTLVVLGWGERLHRKTSMTELIQDAGGERSGYWWQNDTLYVQRANGTSPTGSVLHAGYQDNLIWLQKDNWRIANLTLRFVGGLGAGYGIRAGGGATASGSSFDSLLIYGTQRECIIGIAGTHNIQVSNCTMDGLTVGSWVYGASKARNEENVNAVMVVGRGWSLRNITARGLFNGVGIGNTSAADSTGGSDCELTNSTITDCADDAVELDNSWSVNTVVAENTILRTSHGISNTPIWVGPCWVLYNTIANTTSGAFKMGGPSDGYALFAHNTCTTQVPNGKAINSVGGRFTRRQWRNNIMIGKGASNYTVYNNYSAIGDTAGTYTNDFNYNLLDSIATTRLFRWRTNDYSLASLRANAVGFAWETNGRQGVAVFADSAANRYWTTWGSTAIDGGCRLTGINTLNTRTRGAAPDAGRFEFPYPPRLEK